MTRRVLAFGALLMLVLAAAGIAGALDGDPPANTGWWTDQPGASAQPEGGFQVAGVAGQAVTVAAVRFSTPSGVTSATLSLQESGGYVLPTTALQVCPTSDPWTPANPGPSADAPKPDCTNPIALTRDADKLVWSADVGTLLPSLGGDPSLMIVPSATGGGGSPLDPGFSVTFSAAALTVVAAPGTTTTVYAPTPSGGGSFSPSFGGSSSGTVNDIGPVTPSTVPSTPPAAAAAPSSQEAFAPPALAAGATPGDGGGGGAHQPWERLLFLVPISAGIGVGAVYGKRLLQQRGVLEEA